MRIRIGTRGSTLARRQTQTIADALGAGGAEIETIIISTTGDRTAGPLTPALGTGVFTHQLERALLASEIDLAVHSLKDLPTAGSQGLTVAIPPREDARDALVSSLAQRLADLPAGTRVGTSSIRRQSALRKRFPCLSPEPLRGNVDTRLARLAAGDYGAILVARAGLRRLGRDVGVPVPTEDLLPAPAQGALAIQTRIEDQQTTEAAARLHDPLTAAACAAERALLRRLEGGCQLPIGALARVEGEQLHLRGALWSIDGGVEVLGQRSGAVSEAAALGQALADEMLANGGAEILQSLR